MRLWKGPLKWLGNLAMIGGLIGVTLHYLRFGPKQVEEHGRCILRYTLVERVMHWIAALTYVYVLLTGLAFYSPHLYWIAAVLGGAPTSRFWHPWVALVFLASLVWMLARLGRPTCASPRVDRRWGEAMERYIRNDDEDLPPIDRFNLGQKYFFWVMLFAGVGAAAFRSRDVVPGNRAVQPARGATLPSCCTWPPRWLPIGAFIIHVYMGTAVVRGGFTSIIRGEVYARVGEAASPPLVSSRHG